MSRERSTDGKQPDQVIEELHEAIRVRDDFMVIAAHELRNPMTPILLCLGLIRSAEESNDRTKVLQELDRLERQIKRFVARTTILLEVAQVRSGKLRLALSPSNLSELVAAVVNDYTPLAVRSGSEVTVKLEDEVMAFVDPMAVSEIVENLLSNAIKYGQRKPIEITLTSTPEAARITVRDHGIGIEDRDKVRIFERFERAVGGPDRSGFGIGLWLSRNLAELMGGSITVDGESGAGSLFSVYLPIKPQENP